ncbi:hypothetical protein C1H46_032514 [Malus baccata]|uniref:Uncharacterized protein n=1 Tax=Malus baccata TaxID=106549 RepID=A0A540L660_MALBA|nr:hypothetical protein C1H46_032514 [Malus baccata]
MHWAVLSTRAKSKSAELWSQMLKPHTHRAPDHIHRWWVFSASTEPSGVKTLKHSILSSPTRGLVAHLKSMFSKLKTIKLEHRQFLFNLKT